MLQKVKWRPAAGHYDDAVHERGSVRDPVVSVVLPVRDGAAFLAGALESLSAQTFPGFEVVVVDDGSTDDSPAIASAHGRRDARFRVLRQGREGIVAALERARREARGRFLARMDADDVALPDRLRLQLDALEREGLDAVGGGVEIVSEGRVTDGLRRYEAWLNSLVTEDAAARDVFVECPLPHPTLLARHEAVERAGGYHETSWPEDYDLVLRLWAAGACFRNVEPVVLRWRDRAARQSRTDPRYGEDAFVRCKVHHLRRTLLGAGRPAVVWGSGPVGKRFVRELLGGGVTVEAFVDVDPRKHGKRIYGVPVVPTGESGRYRDAVALGAVAGADGRARVRELAYAEGRRDGEDFAAVA
jgi:glycosyltransferase involved in cell wall biosynthesis